MRVELKTGHDGAKEMLFKGIGNPARRLTALAAGALFAANLAQAADSSQKGWLDANPAEPDVIVIFNPNPPELCAGHGERQDISLTTWESGLESWTVGRRAIASPDLFETPDWAVVSVLPDTRPGSAAFVANLDVRDCENRDETGVLMLDSPPIGIPEGTLVPRIAIDHWVATEFGYDGGNLKISRNGGDFQDIPPAAIEFNSYNTALRSLSDGNSNPLAGQMAFSGADGEELDGNWGQTQINLHGIAQAGDSVVLRFDYGMDVCLGITGWYVDDVRFYSCAAELPPSDCGNRRIDPGEQCDDGNSFIDDGCSNTCQVEDGWQCTDPTEAGEVPDGGFEAGSPNPFWTEESTHFDSLICALELAGCGAGDVTGPAEGSYWAWLGGITLEEESSLSQTLTIPSHVSELEFETELSFCDSAADYMELLIDDNPVYRVDGGSHLCGRRGYTTQTVDISPYADGLPHTIEFHFQSFSVNEDITNIFIDEVRLPGRGSVCRPVAPQLTLLKVLPNDDGGTATADDFQAYIDGNPVAWGVPVELAPGAHTASEDTLPGYSAGPWQGDCDGGGGITLALGENRTCSITNDDVASDSLIFLDGFEPR
jgi:cysteine-rich repeat protein